MTRANLDGTDPIVLASGLYNPNSVVYSRQTGVLFVDSRHKLKGDGDADVNGLMYKSVDDEGGVVTWNIIQDVHLVVSELK